MPAVQLPSSTVQSPRSHSSTSSRAPGPRRASLRPSLALHRQGSRRSCCHHLCPYLNHRLPPGGLAAQVRCTAAAAAQTPACFPASSTPCCSPCTSSALPACSVPPADSAQSCSTPRMHQHRPGPRCSGWPPDARHSPSIPPAAGSPPIVSIAASVTIRRISHQRGSALRIGPVGGSGVRGWIGAGAFPLRVVSQASASDWSFWRGGHRARQARRWSQATWRHSWWQQSGQRARLWCCSRCIAGRSFGCDGTVHGACGGGVGPVNMPIRL